MFTVTRHFVRARQTPILILPDDIPPHPYAVAMGDGGAPRPTLRYTETYTKSIENDAFCVPENVGRTTTYKLDNY